MTDYECIMRGYVFFYNRCTISALGKDLEKDQQTLPLTETGFIFLCSRQASEAKAPQFPNEDPRSCRTPLRWLKGPMLCWQHVNIVWALYRFGLKDVQKLLSRVEEKQLRKRQEKNYKCLLEEWWATSTRFSKRLKKKVSKR